MVWRNFFKWQWIFGFFTQFNPKSKIVLHLDLILPIWTPFNPFEHISTYLDQTWTHLNPIWTLLNLVEFIWTNFEFELKLNPLESILDPFEPTLNPFEPTFWQSLNPRVKVQQFQTCQEICQIHEKVSIITISREIANFHDFYFTFSVWQLPYFEDPLLTTMKTEISRNFEKISLKPIEDKDGAIYLSSLSAPHYGNYGNLLPQFLAKILWK